MTEMQSKDVISRFSSMAGLYPDKPAVAHGDEAITYGVLDHRSNQVARALRENGVRPGTLVGISIPPSLETALLILAVLKCGAAYVPIDAAYPEHRRYLMMRSLAEMSHVVAHDADLFAERCEATAFFTPDQLTQAAADLSDGPLGISISPEQLCYVVFTSGTTGTPKATAVDHAGWENLLSWFEHEYGLNANSNNLLVSAFGFDISQRSIMTPLFTGATLVLMPTVTFDPFAACRQIERHRVETLHLAPSTLYAIAEGLRFRPTALRSLCFAFIGGEPLNLRRLEGWPRDSTGACQLVHQYGTAECTDVSSSFVISDFEACLQEGIPLGSPVANCTLELLDEQLRPVPDGETGEIYIGGAGVGRGYLNNAELTNERFLQRSGQRLYKTGDLARKRSDGELLFVGRTDNQVKIRGIRVDIGDIETALKQVAAAKEAIVVPLSDEEDPSQIYLAAFVLLGQRPEVSSFDLATSFRRDLASHLPAHMIPRDVRFVSEFPITQNGKIDRMALKRLSQEQP